MLTLVVAAVVVATLASFAQAVTGFGFALVAIPLLALVVNAPTAIVAVTLLSAVLTTGASIRHRRALDWPVATKLTVSALIGMPVGLVALTRLDAQWLTTGIAVVVLLFAIATLRQLPLSNGTFSIMAAGMVGGAFLTSTGMNGPPLVAALQAMDFSPSKLRATLQGTFAAQDLLAVLGFGLVGQFSRDIGIIVLVGLPGVAIGWLVGDRIFKRIDAKRFRGVVLLTLLGSAVMLIVQAISN